jgi:hypothetical protein
LGRSATKKITRKTSNISCSENDSRKSNSMSNTTVYYNAAICFGLLFGPSSGYRVYPLKIVYTFLILSTNEVYIDDYMLASLKYILVRLPDDDPNKGPKHVAAL